MRGALFGLAFLVAGCATDDIPIANARCDLAGVSAADERRAACVKLALHQEEQARAARIGAWGRSMSAQSAQRSSDDAAPQFGFLSSERAEGQRRYCTYTDGRIVTVDGFKSCPR